jgi:hypothetical protein
MVPFRRPPVAAAGAFTHAALVLVNEAIQRGRMLDGEGLAPGWRCRATSSPSTARTSWG